MAKAELSSYINIRVVPDTHLQPRHTQPAGCSQLRARGDVQDALQRARAGNLFHYADSSGSRVGWFSQLLNHQQGNKRSISHLLLTLVVCVCGLRQF